MPTEPMCMDVSPTIHRQFSRIKNQGGFENDQDLMQAALKALDDVLIQQQRTPPHPTHTHGALEPFFSAMPGSPDDYDI